VFGVLVLAAILFQPRGLIGLFSFTKKFS
jgi:hypothetical protein